MGHYSACLSVRPLRAVSFLAAMLLWILERFSEAFQVRAVLFFVSESAFGKFPAMAPVPQPQTGEKRAAAAAKVVVPATEKKQKVENGGAGQKPPAEPLTQPAMPEDEHAGAEAFMRKVVPWAPKTADR